MKEKSLTKKRAIKDRVSLIAFYMILILLWQLLFWLGTDRLHLWKSYAFPSPAGVAGVLVRLLVKGSLLNAFCYSMVRAITGFAISVAAGLMLGILLSLSERLHSWLHPLLLGLQTLPSICWVPFAILWFGLDESAVIFVIIMGSAFSIALSTRNGIRNVNPLWIKAARTMGIDKRRLYTRVMLPAALPDFIAGLRQGWSFAWRALMSGEVMSATVGLGHTLMMGRDMADINQVMLVMIIIVAIGVLIDKIIFCRIENGILSKRGMQDS